MNGVRYRRALCVAAQHSPTTASEGVDHSNEPEWMQKARQAPLRTNGRGTLHDGVNGYATKPTSTE